MNNYYSDPQEDSQKKPEDDWLWKKIQKKQEMERLEREAEEMERLNNLSYQSDLERNRLEQERMKREWYNP